MIRAIGAHLRRYPYLIGTLFFILVALSGTGSNYLVIWVNDGKMPVAIHQEDIFFGLASEQFATNMLPLIQTGAITEGHFDAQHTILTTHTKLPLLSDRILVHTPGTMAAFLPPWTDHILQHTWFPRSERGGLISIGDILQWTGLTLLILGYASALLWQMLRALYRLVTRK